MVAHIDAYKIDPRKKRGKARRREKREPERKKKGAFSPEFARASRDANDACAYLYCSWTWLEPTCQLTLIAWKEKKTCFSCTSAFVCDLWCTYFTSIIFSLPLHPLAFLFCFFAFPSCFITHPDPSFFPFGEELNVKKERENQAREKNSLSISLHFSLSLSLLQNACRRKPNRGEGRKKEGIVVVFILLIEFIHTREHTHTHTRNISTSTTTTTYHSVEFENETRSKAEALLLFFHQVSR